MGTLATEALGRARPGRVLTLYCSSVDDGRHQLREATEELTPTPTLVALEWQQAPSLARELYEIRDALADAARSLWPNWYITAEQRFERERSALEDVTDLVTDVTRASPGVSASWLREAWQRSQEGRLPVIREMACAEQVRQLSLALDPTRLVFSLSVCSDEATSARVHGLARAAEWLAREAQAKVLLLVPRSWQGHAELDHVNYGGLVLAAQDEAKETLPAPHPPPPLGSTKTQDASTDDSTPKVVVGPIVGKPHPASEVEQLVHQCIMADVELRDLFEYNQRLSISGQNYIVDLVWRAGGLVVELDGLEHHGAIAYAKDRERDFHLFISGYATLRIPNAQIQVDVDTAIKRIRTMVQYLKGATRR